MSLTEKLGILGGSFDPIHVAHMLIAQEAWYRYELSRVLFVPAARNPLKPDTGPEATAEQRLAMLKLALRGDARFAAFAWELRRGGASYTIETLRHVRSLHPDAELYLLLGSDAAMTLPKWKDIGAYRQLCTVVVCNRPGQPDLQHGLPTELNELDLRIEVMPLPQLDISASDIRKRLRTGRPIRYFVNDEVAEFIHRHELYIK